jgi:serine/threonine protein kinase
VSEGLSFGAYRVVRKVGQGGMGAVYLGEHTLIGRRAAIKVLHRDRSSQRENIERFFTEARATSAVEDPGIVQIYDFGVTPDGTAYLVMEYLDGESLRARLRRLRLLAPRDAVRITRQIAASLAAAHTLGIVHRDLKPENLFMVRDGETSAGERPKILDFGIAKLGGDDARERFRTRTGAVMGTPAYMSPEQCNDTGKIDPRTDVYSLGCVLFHLLTGRPPFDFEGVGATIAAHLKEPPPRPSHVAAHVPAIVDPLSARCLAKRPEDRFSNMLELQQACDAVLAQLPLEPTRIADPFPSITDREDATTTLGSSVGQSSIVRPRRVGLWVGVSAAAVAMGIVLAVMTTTPEIGGPTTITPAIAPTITPTPRETPPVEPVKTVEPAKPESVKPPTVEPAKSEKSAEPDKAAEPVAPKDRKPTTGKTSPPRKTVPKPKPKPAGNVYDDRI